MTSVSVIHDSSMHADALATALMVMGADEGYQFAQEKGLAALFINRRKNGFTEKMTADFKKALAY